MADVSYGSLPFKEQIEFFRRKLNLSTQAWTDIWQAEHDHTFVVAGANRADLVADLRAAVDKAIANGATLAEFRKDFDAIVAKYGWDYHGGRNWRSRVIYETNLRSSYAAGRYAQLQAVKKWRPYWQYVHADGEPHPRPLHLAWNGMVLHADDPWWRTHYPPNGWGCQCVIHALNARDLKRLGKDGPDKAPPDNLQTVTVGTRGPTPRTVETPAGVDPGFGYTPGKDAWLKRAAERHVDPVGGAPLTSTDLAAVGREALQPLVAAHADDYQALRTAIVDLLQSRVNTRASLRATGSAIARTQLQQAAELLPDSWKIASDQAGEFSVRVVGRGRGWCWTAESDRAAIRLANFGVRRNVTAGMGFQVCRRGDIGNTLHELVHRIQATRPDIDALFQSLHRARTAGDALKKLRLWSAAYASSEITREDHYFSPYQGKEYDGGAAGGANEVFTMAMEALLGGGLARLKLLLDTDPDMAYFTLGVVLKIQ